MKIKFFSVSSIVYVVDMTNPESDTIHIANIIRISTIKPNHNICISFGKKILSPEEMSKIGFMGKRILKNPREFVDSIVKDAFSSKEDILKSMEKNLMYSIRLEKIREINVPKELKNEVSNLVRSLKAEKNVNKSISDFQTKYMIEKKIRLDYGRSISSDFEDLDYFSDMMDNSMRMDTKNIHIFSNNHNTPLYAQ